MTASDNGVDAIQLMFYREPEVAIIDVGMPVMDGFQVARQVRLDTRLNALPGYGQNLTNPRHLLPALTTTSPSHSLWTSWNTSF